MTMTRKCVVAGFLFSSGLALLIIILSTPPNEEDEVELRLLLRSLPDHSASLGVGSGSVVAQGVAPTALDDDDENIDSIGNNVNNNSNGNNNANNIAVNDDVDEDDDVDSEDRRRLPPRVNDFARILNLKDFRLLIEAPCNYPLDDLEDWALDGGNSAQAVWIITTYAGDMAKRSALRRAYPNEELRQLGLRRVFLLGTLDAQAEQKTGVTQWAIRNEDKRFRDIVQGNFIEAYRNLTYKHLMGLQWAAEKCSDSYSYIIKMDDDIIVNIYEVMDLLRNKSSANVKDSFLMGYLMEHIIPVRDKVSKWFVTEEEYSKAFYPSYLSGWFYMTDILTALKLIYQSKQHNKYFWIDDLFVTGVLRNEAGINDMINIKDYFALDYRFLQCCLKNGTHQPKYKCDFIIGPDGGDSTLLPNFKKYSEDCHHKYNCTSLPKNSLLKDKCILDDRILNTQFVGNAQVVKLNSAF